MLLKCESHRASDTHLVDNDEKGVEEHQVVFLQGQVAGLLQSEEHRSQQGDLRGAKQSFKTSD